MIIFPLDDHSKLALNLSRAELGLFRSSSKGQIRVDWDRWAGDSVWTGSSEMIPCLVCYRCADETVVSLGASISGTTRQARRALMAGQTLQTLLSGQTLPRRPQPRHAAARLGLGR